MNETNNVPDLQCSRCANQATFNTPEYLCNTHWAEWWVEGVEEPKRTEYLLEVLAELNKIDSMFEYFLNDIADLEDPLPDT